MKKQAQGFTFIEVLVFIIVLGILASTLLLAETTSLKNAPPVHQQWVAQQIARQCMEWFLGQRRMLGYSTFSCPNSSPTSTLCTAPTGYSVATNVACTTWNGDSNYMTITVTVSGLANATLSTQIGNY